MKKILLLIFADVWVVLMLTGCSTSFNHYEDKLYSESIFVDAGKNEATDISNTFTKQKSIERALELFKTGMKIEIDREKYLESVRLNWNQKLDAFAWEIIWQRNINKADYEYYYCIINSSNGQLLSLTCNSAEISKSLLFNKEKTIILKDMTKKLSEQDMLKIVEPIFSAQEIDCSNFKIVKRTKNMEDRGVMQLYVHDEKSDNKVYVVSVSTKDLKPYEIFMIDEIKQTK